MRIQAIFPQFGTKRFVSYTYVTLTDLLVRNGADVTVWFPACGPESRRRHTREVFSKRMWAVMRRLDRSQKPTRALLEWSFLRALRPGDTAYVWPMLQWPNFSRGFYERIKQRGNTLVIELANCLTPTRRRCIEEGFTHLGWPINHLISEEQMETERELCQQADYIFCPSPWVKKSVLDEGIAESKVLSSSYGWDTSRFAGHTQSLEPIEGPTFLFVGWLDIRKGAPMLLEAWARAGLKGRLVMAGKLESPVDVRCADLLKRPDVVHIPFTDDMGALYRSADAFIFPTLEEGSPLAVYEAMGNGLPVMVSPMGAGEVVRDGIEGLIINPFDQDGMIATMRCLASDRELRETMSAAARARAAEYTWENTGARRFAQWRRITGGV